MSESSYFRRQSGFRITLMLSALFSIFVSVAVAHAASCDDQKGKVIFEDTFADDEGGWESDPNAKAGGGKYAIHMNSGSENWQSLNATFNASEADYCMEFITPKSIAPDNPIWVGLIFWASDYENFLCVEVSSDGKVELWKKAANKWTLVGDLGNLGTKFAADSVAVIRIQAAGNLIAPSVNGMDLKKVRAQMPAGALRFGIYISTTKDNPGGVDTNVKRFRVTDVGK